MAIIHIVLFQFQPSATPEQISDVCKRMLSLCDTCRHPSTNEVYVRTHGGGKNNSPEGLDGGFTHGFVSEFVNEEDREYYLNRDPVHLGFVRSLEGIVESVRVVDYTPWVY